MTSKTLSFYRNLKLTSHLHLRKSSSVPKFELNDEVGKLLIEEKIKPKKHPGIIKRNVVELPEWIVKGIDQSLDDVNKPQLFKERIKFANYLFSRRLPSELNEVKNKYEEIEKQFIGNMDDLSDKEFNEKRKKVKNQVNFKLKEKVFGWKPMDYNGYKSLLYLITRSPAEYSVLNTIFNEIQIRDPDFKPETVFDFGSGAGSVLWAVLERWKNINEYLAIDISNEMNELCENILKHRPKKFKKAFYRQYLPISNLKFDLVVSAYSLMELPDTKNRLAAISKLWRKTNKYLVIVEQGSNAGFKIVNEARDFIRHIEKKNENSNYFTFAPCPHDLSCPRHREGKTPCNFLTRYMSLPLLGPSTPKEELYSYIVLKKGCRKENDQWPRVVRKTLRRSEHVWCHLCTPDGKLVHSAFTAPKNGKHVFKCIKASRWGDRVPVIPSSTSETSTDLQETISESELESESESESEDEEAEESVDEKKKLIISEAPFSYEKK